MDLSLTSELMVSKNYRERFIAEYLQTKERYDRLHRMIVRYDAGSLDFVPCCSVELLKRQAKAMGEYLYMLEVRAETEKIVLPKFVLEIDMTKWGDVNGK